MFQKNEEFVYTVTKIFGVDAVKTKVFYQKEDAKSDIQNNITMCSEDDTNLIVEEREDEVYYILNKTESNPTEYIEFVLRRCKIN